MIVSPKGSFQVPGGTTLSSRQPLFYECRNINMKNVLFCRSLFTLSIALTLPFAGSAVAGNKVFTFDLVSSQKLLPNAHGQVRIQSFGPVEVMNVKDFGLPPNTDFDFFVIQQPTAPFGLSWYQGDIETNGSGVGFGVFVGRFSIETFIVAPLAPALPELQPGVARAPIIHNTPPFPDASTNPPTFPVHTYHLGLWFNSPQDAKKAVNNDTITPFNGEHHAGVQVLNSSNFQGNGPLFFLQP
jgi:hypothetical protein